MVAVHLQAFFHGFFFVVFALHQGFAGDIVNAFDLGGIEFDVVRAARGRVAAPAAHAVDDGLERHVDLQHVVQLHASGLHGIGLGDGAGEAVKQKAFGAVGLGDAVFHQIDDELVADQLPRIHHRLGLQAQGGASLYSGTQHIAGGDLGNAKFFADKSSLGAFASAGGAQQDESHGFPREVLKFFMNMPAALQ